MATLIERIALVLALALAGIGTGTEAGNSDCAFRINNYWTDVVHDSIWDRIVADHPELAPWRGQLPSQFKVWEWHQSRYQSYYFSSASFHGHSFTLKIPDKKHYSQKMWLEVESDYYPWIYDDEGDTNLVNRPFVELHVLWQQVERDILKCYDRPSQAELSTFRRSGNNRFILGARIGASIKYSNMHLFNLVLKRLKRSNLAFH